MQSALAINANQDQDNNMNKKSLTLSTLALTFALSGISATTSAAQVATDPGDYSPLPAGLDLGILYLQSFEHDDYYIDGDKLANGPTLSADIGLLRWVHFIDVGGFIVDPQIIVPFGQLELNAGGQKVSASGVGDPIVGGTIWLYNNIDTKQAFGVTGLISLPWGRYETAKGPVNIGENRTKLITQAAYVTPITEHLSLHVIGEYTFFGDNDDFGANGVTRAQDDQYGFQIHTNYHVSDITTLSFTYYHDFGGETKVNDVKQNDELDNNRWQLGVQHFIQPDVQLQIQYGQSIDVKNGFYENNRLNFRVVKVF